jgi:hypothetical protein
MDWTSLFEQSWMDAFIGFSATFSGIAASFWIERRRSRKQEKEKFGRILQSLLYESSHNNALLNNIIKQSKVGFSSGFTLNTQVLDLALTSTVFHQWASHSLVIAVSFTKSQVQFVNNMLSMYRIASVSGREMTVKGVEELKIRATSTQGVIRILQERLDVIMPQFGASIRSDDETKRITDVLVAKLREEPEALLKLDPGKR